MTPDHAAVIDLSTDEAHSRLPNHAIGLVGSASRKQVARWLRKGLRTVVHDETILEQARALQAPKPAELESWTLSNSTDKHRVIGELTDLTASISGSLRRAQSVASIADELLLNAIYAAPVDPRGRRLFAERDRSEAVALPAPVDLLLGTIENTLVLRCSDPYGSCELGTAAEALARGLSAGPEQVRPSGPGAGLGLFMVYLQSSELWLEVTPGESTVVQAVIGRGPCLLALRNRGRE